MNSITITGKISTSVLISVLWNVAETAGIPFSDLLYHSHSYDINIGVECSVPDIINALSNKSDQTNCLNETQVQQLQTIIDNLAKEK